MIVFITMRDDVVTGRNINDLTKLIYKEFAKENIDDVEVHTRVVNSIFTSTRRGVGNIKLKISLFKDINKPRLGPITNKAIYGNYLAIIKRSIGYLD